MLDEYDENIEIDPEYEDFLYENPELNYDDMSSDSVRRLAFHLAMRVATEESVSKLFASIPQKNNYDITI